MERLTEKRDGKNVIPLRNAVCDLNLPYWKISGGDIEKFLEGDAADRLAAYEDTGLSPRQITMAMDTLKLCDSIGAMRMNEILDAERDGRLVVLPCKVGDTVWGVVYDTRDCPHCVGVGGCFGCSKANPIDVYRTDFKLHMVEQIGRTLFITRAEAEAALKGVSEDG